MILGIDPGGSKPHAIAGFDYEGYKIVFKEDNIERINASIKLADKVYIESQYFGGNPSTLILLSHRTGMLMGLCELHNVPYKMIAPISWQSSFSIPSRRPKDLTPYKWKKKRIGLIIEKARELTDYRGNDSDESCAILIGLYGLNRLEEA